VPRGADESGGIHRSLAPIRPSPTNDPPEAVPPEAETDPDRGLPPEARVQTLAVRAGRSEKRTPSPVSSEGPAGHDSPIPRGAAVRSRMTIGV